MKPHHLYAICILSFLLIPFTCYTQDKKPKRHLIEMGGGGSFFLSSMNSDNPAYQLNHKRRNVPLFSMQYSYFFNYHWGIYANLEMTGSGKKTVDFYHKYVTPYENSYYVEGYSETQRESTTLGYGTIGFSYRKHWKRWSLRSRLGIGRADTQAAHLRFTLKGKDNNEVRELIYREPNGEQFLGILTTGITLSRHLSRRISIYTAIDYLQSYQKPSTTIYEKDLYDDSVLRKEKYRAPLPSHIHIHAGIGIHL